MTDYVAGERAFYTRDLAEAYRRFEAAATSPNEPTRKNAVFQLGRIADLMGEHERALVHFDHYLGLAPDSHDVTFMRGTVRLLLKDFDRGWQDYRAYYETRKYTLRPHPFPLWDGRQRGRRVLLFSDQGQGDALQFIRYQSAMRDHFPEVVFFGKKSLQRLLLANGGYHLFVPDGAVQTTCPGGTLKALECDAVAPLSILPGWFDPAFDSLDPSPGYLRVDQELTERSKHYVPRGEFKIGIAWKGDPATPRDIIRSFPAEVFRALTGVPGIHLYSLQMDSERGEAESIGGPDQVTDFAPAMRGNDPSGLQWDFMSTACIIANLDLIVTCDSVIAHLAGAIGKPVWVVLPYGSEWRWLRREERTGWYRSMRLFRQTTYVQPLDRGWEEVFSRIRDALPEEMRSR